MADVEKGINPANFSFRAPTQNVDGTPVNGPLNYNLYRTDRTDETFTPDVFFTVVGTLQPDGSYLVPIEDFPEGRNVIALSAVDVEGDESVFSNTLGFFLTDQVVPNPPLLLS